MARLHELKFAEFAGIEQFLHEKILARIHDGFGHHVFQPGLLHEFHDLLAVLDVRGHRHGAGDVLAGLQRGDGLPAVIGNGRVDVDRIDVWIFEQILEFRVAFPHAEVIADLIQLLLGALADRVHVGIGMPLIERDEFRAEAKSHNGDVYFFLTHQFCVGPRAAIIGSHTKAL